MLTYVAVLGVNDPVHLRAASYPSDFVSGQTSFKQALSPLTEADRDDTLSLHNVILMKLLRFPN